MAQYTYKALTESGSTHSGSIEASSLSEAKNRIAAEGFIPLDVKKASSSSLQFNGLNRLFHRVKPTELILFTKQFRTMISAGLSVLSLLDVLEQQTENPRLKKAVIDIHSDIKSGSSLHAAFAKHGDIFDHLYCSMLHAGEISGQLPSVLERLSSILQHESEVKKQISSAMTYPCIVLTALFGAFLFLLTFVIPKFMGIFESASIELPLPTRICIIMYTGLSQYWALILLALAGAGVGLTMFLRQERGQLWKDRLILRIPIVSPVILKAAMSRFASIFALLQASGVSVINSVDILAETIGNAAISRVFKNLKSELREGRGISGPLKNSPYFTPLVINMIAIGEETGNLDEMLKEVAAHYDYEVDYSVKRMADLIGPLLILVLAGVVGFFALAVFLPMWDLTNIAG